MSSGHKNQLVVFCYSLALHSSLQVSFISFDPRSSLHMTPPLEPLTPFTQLFPHSVHPLTPVHLQRPPRISSFKNQTIGIFLHATPTRLLQHTFLHLFHSLFFCFPSHQHHPPRRVDPPSASMSHQEPSHLTPPLAYQTHLPLFSTCPPTPLQHFTPQQTHTFLSPSLTLINLFPASLSFPVHLSTTFKRLYFVLVLKCASTSLNKAENSLVFPFLLLTSVHPKQFTAMT